MNYVTTGLGRAVTQDALCSDYSAAQSAVPTTVQRAIHRGPELAQQLLPLPLLPDLQLPAPRPHRLLLAPHPARRRAPLSEITNTEFTTHNTASGTQLTSTDDTLRINIITNKCLITILCYFVVYGNDFVCFQ